MMEPHFIDVGRISGDDIIKTEEDNPMRSPDWKLGDFHIALLAAVFAAGMVWPAAASSFDEAMDARAKGNAASQNSQEKVDSLADAADKALGQYRSVTQQHDGVRVFNKHMQGLITEQNEEIRSINQQIDDIELVARQVTPLMLKMIDGIERFVELDVPFLLDERTKRIAGLRTLMERSDVSEAEKYRGVMEAYQIENDFGRTIESYQDTLELEGTPTEVDFLRIGRVALVYLTFDGTQAGAWNQRTRQWESLDRSFTQSIKGGLRMARKQAAPSLIITPIPAAEDK